MPRAARRDRGEGAVAYISIVLLIAAMTAATVASGLGGYVTGAVQGAVCKVSGTNCWSPRQHLTPTPGIGNPTATPIRATSSPSPSSAVLDGKTQAALEYMRKWLAFMQATGHYSGLPAQGGLYDLIHQLQGLSPAELNQLLGQLSPQELAQLNTFYNKFQWSSFGVPQDAKNQNPKVTLANLLLSQATPDQLARLLQNVSSLRPSIGDKEVPANQLAWAPDNAPLFSPKGPNIEDVIQGNLGDCWFLAALSAVVKTDPNFIRDHIHQNSNGTDTVTLYENGQPVQVTVDPTLPSKDGSSQEYAKTPDNASTWVAIYEKALAEQMGGYVNTEGNSSKAGLDLITGKGASLSNPNGYLDGWVFGLGSSSLSDVQKNLDHGEAVVTATVDKPGAKNVVESHVYTVIGVNPQGHPPTITLRNPWGAWAPPNTPEYITLTEDQWKSNFNEMAGVKP